MATIKKRIGGATLSRQKAAQLTVGRGKVSLGSAVLAERGDLVPHAFNRHELRLAEIGNLIVYRHPLLPSGEYFHATADGSNSKKFRRPAGGFVPEGVDNIPYLDATAAVLHDRAPGSNQNYADLERFCGWCAPWVLSADKIHLVDNAMASANARTDRLSDQECGQMLGLKFEERTALSIRTMIAVDIAPDVAAKKMKARKKGQDRKRAEDQRRAAGAIPREDYETKSAENLQPWKAEGISRATWYRRKPKK